MSTTIDIQGTCDPRFEQVRHAFAENFAERGEVGAAVSVAHEGQLVVDLWAGYADAARIRAWQPDTLVNVFSTTKGIIALCAHMLVDRGQLDLDAPVARYWPEFAQAGKDTIPVRYLLSHQAGMAGARQKLTAQDLYNWQTVTAALASQEPWWEPGTQHGYHAITYGYLVGELITRITGLTPGAFLRQELTEPLGLDFHIGVSEEFDPRIAELIPPPPLPAGTQDPLAALAGKPKSMAASALANPAVSAQLANTADWRAAEIPAANGHGTARGLARVYGALAHDCVLDGKQLLSQKTLAQAIEQQCVGKDAVLKLDMSWALGFILSGSGRIYGPNPDAFGHSGYGGSFGCADTQTRLGIGYTMNFMSRDVAGDKRGIALIKAAHASL